MLTEDSELKKCVCFDCSNVWPFLLLSPSPWSSLFPETTILKLGQLITLRCIQVKGSHIRLILKQKLEMIKLSEEAC